MSTRRYAIYGQCLILLIAAECWGQGYDTNAWPAYLHSRSGRIHASNTYSALVERASTYHNDPASEIGTAPSWFRTQRSDCITLKSKLKAVISGHYWVAPTNTYTIIQNIINSYTSEPYGTVADNVAGVSNIWNHIDFLSYCRMPTNFLDYTPYRGLDGVGPFTNDATVGHPHGWTNAYTINGGTNFPAGRTAWYTTDYGWDGMRNLTTNLQKRQHPFIGAYWNDKFGSSGDGESNSFALAQAQAEASLTNQAGVGFKWYSTKSYYGGSAYYYQFRGPIIPYNLQLPTNGPDPDATGIFRTWTIPTVQSTYGYDGAQLGFTDRGAWPTNPSAPTAWGWQTQPATNTGNFLLSVKIGGTNQIPVAPEQDPDGSTITTISRGVGLRWHDAYVDDQKAIMFLDYSGKFIFK